MDKKIEKIDRTALEDSVRRLRKIERKLIAHSVDRTLASYNKDKVHVKQMEFHQSKKRNRWAFGGNRSGKTECGAVETVWIATATHPYRQIKSNTEGWIVSLSTEVQRDVAQPKLLKYLSPSSIIDVVMEKGTKANYDRGIIDCILVRNALGGVSKITFKSCDQGREKFQGASLDYVWFDEEPPQDIYEECRMRVLDKRGDLYGTMTPLKGLTWVYHDIYLNEGNDPEVFYVNMSWADNPYLAQEEVARLQSSMSEDVLSTRCYGHFKASSGLVYPQFDEAVHVIDPFDIPTDWQDKLSIDPGLRNPLSCHFYAVDYDGNVYVVAEHYDKDRDVSYHAERINEIADSLNWHRDMDGKLTALIDSAAGQRTLASTQSVAELFRDKGIAVDTRVNKDMFSGIMRVRDVLAERPARLYIFRNCTNLIRELKGYRWGDNDLPIKRDDHSLDELRYYLMSHPQATQPKKTVTRYQKHKQDLVKKINMQKKRYNT